MFTFRKKNYTSSVAKIKLFITLFNRTDNKLQKKKHIRLRKTFQAQYVSYGSKVYKRQQSLTKTGSFIFSLLNAGIEQVENYNSWEIYYIIRKK